MAHNSLLNACAKMGMMVAAKTVFQEMQRKGPPPDIITYNTMLAGYAQVRAHPRLHKIFSKKEDEKGDEL